MAKRYVTHICGGDFRPGPRDACPDPVHDWPEPAGYVDSFEVAESRLRRNWRNVPCPSGCGRYGWRPGRIDASMDHLVSPNEDRTASEVPMPVTYPVGTVLETRCTCGSGERSHGPQYRVEAVRVDPDWGDRQRSAYVLRNLTTGRRHRTSRGTIHTGYIVVAKPSSGGGSG